MSNPLKHAYKKLTILEQAAEKVKIRIILRKTESQKAKATQLFQKILVHASVYREFLIGAGYPIPGEGI